MDNPSSEQLYRMLLTPTGFRTKEGVILPCLLVNVWMYLKPYLFAIVHVLGINWFTIKLHYKCHLNLLMVRKLSAVAAEDVIADTKVMFLFFSVFLLILVEVFLLVVFNFDASKFILHSCFSWSYLSTCTHLYTLPVINSRSFYDIISQGRTRSKRLIECQTGIRIHIL